MQDIEQPDFWRLSEWPTNQTASMWRVSRMDPLSITIQRASGSRASHRAGAFHSDAPPRSRIVVACCGYAAPIAALMLIKGARRVEPVHPGCEPLLVLCQYADALALLGMPTFPPTFTGSELLEIIGDANSLIDGLVVYDIDDDAGPRYLEHLTALRTTVRPGCPIVRLHPCSSVARARAQFDRVRIDNAVFLAAADALYRVLSRAIAERTDVSSADPLERLLGGAIGVEFGPEPHGS